MDKIEILEKRLINLLNENYKEKDIELELKNDCACSYYRKSAFEFILDMINEIKKK